MTSTDRLGPAATETTKVARVTREAWRDLENMSKMLSFPSGCPCDNVAVVEIPFRTAYSPPCTSPCYDTDSKDQI